MPISNLAPAIQSRPAHRRAVRSPFVLLLLASGGLTVGCTSAGSPPRLAEGVDRALREHPGGTVAVAFCDLGSGRTLLRNEHRRFHAASTMKIPVLVALFRAIDQGELALDRPVPVRNEFPSLVDGSPFTLIPGEDGDPDLYSAVGDSRPLGELARRMIVRSSNLSTNLLIELLGAKQVTAAMRDLGAREIEVLRGVEDEKAFEAGLINRATAYDLMVILRAIAEKKAVSAAASGEMIGILEGQEFKEKIPAGLPPGTRVANKTGDITGVHHDAAIVLPAGRAPYVLVVLTEGFPDQTSADRAIAAVSRAVWSGLGLD
ncbi:MAG TPA: serine hydrolase [Thermoanaerobaculia bacterium]|nr:serine hydrolase [Thermoanaerobaculia bacterium]